MNYADDPTSRRIPILFTKEAADLHAVLANAMTGARAAQARWSRCPLARRLELVRELRHLIAENVPQLAEATAFARGRPALESITAEVLPLAEACRFLEREAKNILAPRRLGRRGLPLWLAGVRSEIHREPFGVVLVIGPGNYPLLLPGVQIIQALAAGNAVLLKPGSGGTAAAGALLEIIARAGFDPQLVALLPESAGAAIEAIAARPDKVLFTGSAATGAKILAQLAPFVIPAAMELSGCDAVLIRADADLDLVVRALVFGLRLNAGQTCIAPRRVFVTRSVATEFEGRLAQALAAGAAEPIASAPRERLLPLLLQALYSGAHLLAGKIQPGGEIIGPVVIAGAKPSLPLLREDIFASVLTILTVTDDDEAIALANDCPYALGAAIFARDEIAARSLATRLNVGVVTINDHIVPTADARLPFSGRKFSGFGVTRGAEGLLELTTPKAITVSRGKFRPAFDTPQPGDAKIFQAYLKLSHGRGLRSCWAALISLIRSISKKRKSPLQENL